MIKEKIEKLIEILLTEIDTTLYPGENKEKLVLLTESLYSLMGSRVRAIEAEQLVDNHKRNEWEG